MKKEIFYSVDTPLGIRVTDILLRLGISASSYGYEYLRCAIILAYHDPELTVYATKTLYPTVTRLCHAASVGSVERNCRRAVERAIYAGTRTLYEYFGNITPTHHPTCAKFILTIAEHLHKQDMQSQNE
ncbi:MAG: sporulation initiation factor Spo0A C-terminal domain-containing protein [Clostridia bacterium]|nr:sporulation initiation factor Spo0A C-terminal domain-containing protein [Clostridia bacterium]